MTDPLSYHVENRPGLKADLARRLFRFIWNRTHRKDNRAMRWLLRTGQRRTINWDALASKGWPQEAIDLNKMVSGDVRREVRDALKKAGHEPGGENDHAD